MSSAQVTLHHGRGHFEQSQVQQLVSSLLWLLLWSRNAGVPFSHIGGHAFDDCSIQSIPIEYSSHRALQSTCIIVVQLEVDLLVFIAGILGVSCLCNPMIDDLADEDPRQDSKVTHFVHHASCFSSIQTH